MSCVDAVIGTSMLATSLGAGTRKGLRSDALVSRTGDQGLPDEAPLPAPAALGLVPAGAVAAWRLGIVLAPERIGSAV